MSDMSDNDKSHPDNKKLEKPGADFKGPGENRGCTDILCSCLLIGSWVMTTGVGLAAMGFITNE
jgi:hypothetical protein